jgi:hypothetical protein
LSFHFYLFLVCLPNHNSHSSKHSFSSQYITKRNTLRFGLWYYLKQMFFMFDGNRLCLNSLPKYA